MYANRGIFGKIGILSPIILVFAFAGLETYVISFHFIPKYYVFFLI